MSPPTSTASVFTHSLSHSHTYKNYYLVLMCSLTVLCFHNPAPFLQCLEITISRMSSPKFLSILYAIKHNHHCMKCLKMNELSPSLIKHQKPRLLFLYPLPNTHRVYHSASHIVDTLTIWGRRDDQKDGIFLPPI
jgi:hypothetical protein